MNFEINILEEYREKKLLTKQEHPHFPLFIWNYSPRVQYEKLWDNITLKCRALVTDDLGNIVAKSFDKFFNLEEESDIPKEPYEIYEKMDGSLILIFWYEDNMIISSKGSFTSDHAIQAKRVINNYDLSLLDKSKTYCFELVAPWNRIVCNYSREELYLLAKFDKLGKEHDIDGYNCFPKAKKHSFLELNRIKNTITNDREGVVVKFRSGKRVKIKGAEYVRLHKIVTNLSENSILEIIKNNQSLDSILDNIPDEFYQWAKNVEQSFRNRHNAIFNECKSVYKEFPSRKETAAYFLKQNYPQVLFYMLDRKDPSSLIWKIVENQNLIL